MGWERTLVFVAGASPQIITETVWALTERHRKGGVPSTEVFVLTTTAGRQRIQTTLFGRGGQWNALRRQYPATRNFFFPPENVLVLPGAHGQPLDDVRGEADSIAAGNYILDFVRSRTLPGKPQLHASIAGGRKTMGFLLATAMMLYARVEDELSHVLVRPAELESTDFFFPPKGQRTLTVTQGQQGRVRIPASAVGIDLTLLPFPRLRLLQERNEVPVHSFAGLVQLLQERLAQYVRPTIDVDFAAHRLVCGGEVIDVSPLRAGIYALLAQRRQSHPPATTCPGCEQCFVPAGEVSTSFKEQLSTLMRASSSIAVGRDWSEKNFRPEISKLNALLQRKLGVASRVYEVQTQGERKHRRYGIAAPSELLTVSGLPPTVGGNVASEAAPVDQQNQRPS